MTLISEHQEGECGDDWKYDVAVKVFNEGLKSEAVVSVPKHTLRVGVVEKPHGQPEPLTVFTGECLSELLVRMNLTATEVDLFVNDVGEASMEFKLACPGPLGGSVTKEVEISAGVREAPVFLNKDSVFTVQVRFDLVCE
jgi:hypothetical protein